MQTRDLRLPAEAFAAEFTALAPLLFRSPPILVAHARYLESMYALGNGNPAQALNLIEESKQVYEGTGWLVATAMLHIGTAEVLCALERFEEAESSLESADGLVAGLDCPILRFNGGLVRAEIARRSRTADEFLAALAQALSVGREQGFANGFTGYALLLPRLIPHALRANIEIAYCRSVIARRHLEPPLRDVPNWPWPVRIYAMGALEVLVEDVPLRFQGKAQRRPLDLLKLLLTQRLGIDNPRLMDTMWPDLDGDAARNAFDLTLHRLRKLLGHKDAILLTHGRLMLNPQQVWVDAFAIERLAIERAPGADLVETARDLLALYRGPFLGEDDTSALYLARARLRSQFVRAITELGEALRGQARWDLLVPTVQRAIEVEPLEEELHRSLIHSLIAQRHFTEADAAYRRCESIFARCLGRKPSPSTLHLVADRQFSEP
jgi:DNA-binding SARP family transcriptional activator